MGPIGAGFTGARSLQAGIAIFGEALLFAAYVLWDLDEVEGSRRSRGAELDQAECARGEIVLDALALIVKNAFEQRLGDIAPIIRPDGSPKLLAVLRDYAEMNQPNHVSLAVSGAKGARMSSV